MNMFLLLQKHLHNSPFLSAFQFHYSSFLQGREVLLVIITVADVDAADVDVAVVIDEIVAAGESDAAVMKKLYQMVYNYYMCLDAT